MFTKMIPVLAFFFMSAAFAGTTTTEKVFFVSPKNNDTVPKTFKVKFGQEGLMVKPAGEDVDNKKMGHYHIIVDDVTVAENHVIGTDEKHLHFGKGQTEAEITLTPGPHKLTLLFADGKHRSGGDKLSETITVNVK